jgi:Ulp1 family protease
MDEEQGVVDWATKKGIGSPKEILASQDKESIRCKSMQTLLPKQWLKDKVINFFLKHCLVRRNEKLCEKELGRRQSHFFNSFFVQMMFNLENNDLNLRGRYNYENVRC